MNEFKLTDTEMEVIAALRSGNRVSVHFHANKSQEAIDYIESFSKVWSSDEYHGTKWVETTINRLEVTAFYKEGN